jgi:hypothetical protein
MNPLSSILPCIPRIVSSGIASIVDPSMNLALLLFIDSATTKDQPSFSLNPRTDVWLLATVAFLGSLGVECERIILMDFSVLSIRTTFLFNYSRACQESARFIIPPTMVLSSSMDSLLRISATRTSIPPRVSELDLRVRETHLHCLGRNTSLL